MQVVSLLGLVWHRGQVLLCKDSVAVVASNCLVGRRFQTLCGVVYKPGFGGDCKAHGKYPELPYLSCGASEIVMVTSSVEFVGS